MKYFKCGRIIENGSMIKFYIAKFSDILSILLPFFDKYPILGVKNLDFKDFCKVVELMKNGSHLTKEGLEQIRKIKDNTNTKRVFDYPSS